MNRHFWIHFSALLLLCLVSLPVAAVECNSACYIELIKHLEGGTANTKYIRSECGVHADIDRPALDVFKTHGSLNIPVTCHAALYMEENTIELRTWWREYFEAQKNPPFTATGAGFMGTEVLSPLYGPLTAGPIIVVLDKARQRGHGDVVAEAEDWLQAYFALHSLSSRYGNLTSHSAVTNTGTQTGSGNHAYLSGIISGAAGSRMLNATSGPASLAHPLLSLAANRSPRKYTYSVNSSPGYYGGLKVAAITAGYQIGSDGKITDFATRTAPLSKLGITAAQRTALNGFPGGAWNTHLPTLQAMIGGFKPHCDMTFLRTSEGTASWFGTSSSRQSICNRGKGPFFAVRLNTDRSAQYLAPATASSVRGKWESYRSGNQICVDYTPDGQTTVQDTWCMDLPGGTVLYELAWTKSGGLQLVTGGTPEPEIRVQLNAGAQINTGSTTSFGSHSQIAGQVVDQTFRVWNDGDASLTVSASLSNTQGSAFSLLNQPASAIPAGTSTTFTVRMSRSVAGNLQASVSLQHNASNAASPFTFDVSGTVSSGGGGQLPAGTLDRADCTRIAGWARDPDNTQALEVEIYKGNGTGAPVVTLTADSLRTDLPFADKNHGFSILTPAAFETGQPETVSAFARDVDFNGNPTGSRQQLNLSPKTVTCSGGTPQTMTLPVLTDTWIVQESPTLSYEGSQLLRVRNDAGGFGRRIFLTFQVPTVPGQILSAQLKIRARNNVIQEVGTYRMGGMPWTIENVDWNNHLTLPTSFTFLGSSANLAAATVHAIDVTSAVTGSGLLTLGMASSADVGGQDFDSAESATPPVLEITYQP